MATIYRPAGKIGADFYQTIELDEKNIFYISDITGHSLDGAFLNIFLRETIKTFLTSRLQIKQNLELDKLIEFINYQFRTEDFPEDYFISLLLFVLDKETTEVKYINAGFHIAPILLEGAEKHQLTAKGPPISKAIKPEMYEFREQEFALNPNSTLVVTTDGLIEETGTKGRYGEERWETNIVQNHHLPPQLLLNKIIKDWENFRGETPISDDVTLLALTNRQLIDKLELTFSSKYEQIELVCTKVADFMADYCVEVNQLMIGLQEILINAIEHGNEENYDLQVEVKVYIWETGIVIQVKDQGSGFNWQPELDKEIDLNNFSDCGRGLAIAEQAGDYLGYNQAGNQAILYKKR